MDEHLRAARRSGNRARSKPPRDLLASAETAVVASVGTGGLLRVFLDGDTSVSVPARRLRGVQVAAGDAVALWRRGRKLLVLGRTSVADTGELPFAMAAGSVTKSLTNGNSTDTQAVTFPVGRFAQPPIVTVTNVGGTGSSACIVQANAAPTTSGFTILIAHKDVGGTFSSGWSVLLHWTAVQMTSTAAAG